MRFLAAILPIMFLAGCASTPIEPVPFKGPNTNQAFSMVCSGQGRTLAQCYQKAGEVCPDGYVVVGQGNSTLGVPVNGSVIITPLQDLAIECKAE